VGEEAGVKFWGGSFFANPFGAIIHQTSHDQEEVVVQELDLDKSDYYRSHWPFLRDRRIDSYQPITKRLLDED
jgi:N-carbamoylputrescine amidase